MSTFEFGLQRVFLEAMYADDLVVLAFIERYFELLDEYEVKLTECLGYLGVIDRLRLELMSERDGYRKQLDKARLTADADALALNETINKLQDEIAGLKAQSDTAKLDQWQQAMAEPTPRTAQWMKSGTWLTNSSILEAEPQNFWTFKKAAQRRGRG